MTVTFSMTPEEFIGVLVTDERKALMADAESIIKESVAKYRSYPFYTSRERALHRWEGDLAHQMGEEATAFVMPAVAALLVEVPSWVGLPGSVWVMCHGVDTDVVSDALEGIIEYSEDEPESPDPMECPYTRNGLQDMRNEYGRRLFASHIEDGEEPTYTVDEALRMITSAYDEARHAAQEEPVCATCHTTQSAWQLSPRLPDREHARARYDGVRAEDVYLVCSMCARTEERRYLEECADAYGVPWLAMHRLPYWMRGTK